MNRFSNPASAPSAHGQTSLLTKTSQQLIIDNMKQFQPLPSRNLRVRTIVIALCFTSSVALAQQRAVMPESQRAFFEKYCLNCHDSATKEGKVDLQRLSFDLGTLESAEVWQKVLGALNSGEMPPKDEKQPSAKDKTEFLDILSRQLVVARKMLSDSGGVITMRRLNRREYQNTIRELLGVQVDVSDLPDDSGSGSFDTVGASLFFSSDQFEQYLKIAHRALDTALRTGPKPKPKRVRNESEQFATKRVANQHRNLIDSHARAEQWRASDKPPREFGFIDADRVAFEERVYRQQFATADRYLKDPANKTGAMLYSWFRGAQVVSTEVWKKHPPGKYVLRVRVGATKNARAEQRFLEYGQIKTGARTGELVVQGCRQIYGTMAEPQVLELPIEVTSDGIRKFGVRQRLHNNSDAVQFEYLKAHQKTGVGPEPALWVDWIEWEGPLVETWPPPAFGQIFFKGLKTAHNDEYARAIISRFARQAFRNKDPSNSFVDKLMELYRMERKAEASFVDALRDPLAIVLASPSFLYLSEPTDKKGRELTDRELAVRLSYLLWSSPPDDELYQTALAGKLKTPEVLRDQTNRMLNDPKSMEFVRGFAHQWLDMERLDFFQFNYRLYPQFDESVKKAARIEVYQTIRKLLRSHGGIGELLKSDEIVVNDLLANYYGIKGVKGAYFRKVKVPEDSPRGGLLAMAATLAMGSDGERSSPVERGAWVMRKLLNDPPPPAPANVPQISRLAGKLLPARKLQVAHMEQPQCAQCHRKIDPIGYGLENFNAAGRWRERELTEVVVRNRIVKRSKLHPIDPSGTLPDGAAFGDFFELRDQVAKRESDFARGFTEALIEYGLGRPYGFTDQDLAAQIMKRANATDNRLRTFVLALVQSKPFKTK